MNWSEVDMSLIIGVGALVAAILGFLVAIFNNERLRVSIINSLIRKVKGTQLVTIEDLKTHDLIIKLKQYISVGQHSAESVISDPARADLYRQYVIMLCEVFLESIVHIASKDIVSANEGDLKSIIIEQVAYRRNEYNKRFFDFLLTCNPDKNAATVVLRRIENWRVIECDMINSNILSVISTGNYSVEYKLDIVFYQYCLAIDVLCKNGADSFERLNGELTNFLNSEK